MRRTGPNRRSMIRLLWAACLAGMLLGSAGCARSTDTAPAKTVQQLLELRSSNSTDTAAYLRHVDDTAVVEAIVEDAEQRADGEKATPQWKQPRVVKRSGSKAEVLVEWIASDEFKDWPESTTFIVERAGGGWRVVDAAETSATAE